MTLWWIEMCSLWLLLCCIILLLLCDYACLLCWQVVEFADDESKRVYEEAYEAFKARHLSRDEFVEFSAKTDLPGFVRKLTMHDPNHEVPSWMSSNCFCLAACCCLTWPYRLMFNSAVSSYSYRILKKVVARPVPVLTQPQSVGDLPAPPTVEISAPSLPPPPAVEIFAPHVPHVSNYDQHPDNMHPVPIIPPDHIPSVPPPSYAEFSANPDLFHSTRRAGHESIPLSEMTL